MNNVKRPVLKVNDMGNFDFWLGMFRPRTKAWQIANLKRLKNEVKQGVRPFGGTVEEREDKIKALEFLLKKKVN